MTCEICGGGVAGSYTRCGETLQLCARCLDRMQIQDAYEGQLLELHRLTVDGRYADVLAALDGLFAQHRGRDHDGWLERSLTSHRALVLAEQGDLVAAAAAHRAVIAASPDDHSERFGLAGVLERMGDLDEAVAEVERGLAAITARTAPAALSGLVRLARFCAAQGREVPASHRDALEAAVRWWGLPLPAALLASDAPLAPAIAAADTAVRDAQARYQALQVYLQVLSAQPDIGLVAATLRAYQQHEPVAYYRQHVQDLLRSLP